VTHFARVLRNAANLGSAEAVGKVVGLTTTIVLARFLHADGYGRYAAAVAFGALCAVLADAGLAYFTAREVARAPRAAGRLLWTAYAAHLVLCVTVIALGLLILPLFRFSGPTATAAMLLLCGACADGMTAQALALFRGRQQMFVEARILSLGRVVMLCAVAAVAFFAPTVTWAAAATCGTSLLTATIATIAAARAVRPVLPRRAAAMTMTRHALPFAASGLLTLIFFRVDVLLLRAFGVADAAIGAYSAAYRVMEAPRSAPGVVASSFFPAAAQLSRSADRRPLLQLGGKAVTLVVAAVAPIAVAFAVAPSAITSIVFGSGFAGSAPLLRALSPMPVLMAMNAIAIALINATGGQRSAVAVFALCAAVNVAANVLMIPHLGTMAAAMATVLTEVVELVAFATWIRANVGNVRAPLPGVAVAGVAGLVAAALTPAEHGLWRIAVSTGAYLAVLLPVILIVRRGVAPA